MKEIEREQRIVSKTSLYCRKRADPPEYGSVLSDSECECTVSWRLTDAPAGVEFVSDVDFGGGIVSH